jgi:hypothetical protein
VAEEAVEGTTAAALSAGDLRSQILSSLPDDEDAPEEKPVATAKEDPEEAEAESSEDEDAEETEEASADSDEDEEEEEESDEDDSDEDAEKSDDPKTQKRLDAVRKAEKRMREKANAREAELKEREAKHADRLSRLDQFESLAKRAQYDPVPVLAAMGVPPESYAAVARAIYAESTEGGADPKHKEAAARQLREREKEDKLTATEKRIQDLESKLERKEREAAERAEVDQFVSDVTSRAKAKHPLAAHFIDKDPESANAGIFAAYQRLAKSTGETPKPAAVVAEYDRYERTRLKKLGIDPDAIAKVTTKTAKTEAKSVVKPGAKPANGNGKLTKDEERRAVLAQLAAADPDN